MLAFVAAQQKAGVGSKRASRRVRFAQGFRVHSELRDAFLSRKPSSSKKSMVGKGGESTPGTVGGRVIHVAPIDSWYLQGNRGIESFQGFAGGAGFCPFTELPSILSPEIQIFPENHQTFVGETAEF